MHAIHQIILAGLLLLSKDVQDDLEHDCSKLAVVVNNNPKLAIKLADEMIKKYVGSYGKNELFYGIFVARAKAHIKLGAYEQAIADADACIELNRRVCEKVKQEAIHARDHWHRVKWGSIGAGIAAATISAAIAGGVIGYQRRHAPHAPSEPATPLTWSLTIPF